jgi:O-antigen ligase
VATIKNLGFAGGKARPASRAPKGRFAVWLAQPKTRLYAFFAFLALVFFTGGSSRDDMQHLLVLRPMAALFGAYALAQLNWSRIRELGAPFYLLLALIALLAIQLVPLPPSIWTGLPLREIVLEIEQAIGMEHGWRPLTLSPSKTSNTLAAMIVPLATMLLYAALDAQDRSKVWPALLIFALLSALFGVIQLTGGANSPAYLYRVTNLGESVGLFANRNHHSVFMATFILVAFWYFSATGKKDEHKGAKSTLAVIAAMLLSLAVIFAYSRAGLGIAAVAGLAGVFYLLKAPLIPEKIKFGSRRRISKRWVILGLAGIGIALFAAALFFSRAELANRFVMEDNAEELRWEFLPIYGQMIADSFPAGLGFGTFEYVFPMYEPMEALRPAYVNLAHNDWAQWLMEGGLPAIVIAAAFAIWFVMRIASAWRQRSATNTGMQGMAACVIVLLLLASAVDYPLRTPILMVVFALSCLTLASDGSAKEAAPEKGSKTRSKKRSKTSGRKQSQSEGWQRKA